MKNRSLVYLSRILRILGAIALIYALAYLIVNLPNLFTAGPGIYLVLVGPVFTLGFVGLCIFSAGQLILLLLQMEHNQRELIETEQRNGRILEAIYRQNPPTQPPPRTQQPPSL